MSTGPRDPPEGADASPPLRLGRYELCRKIADGGMAAVYVARAAEGPSSGELVAIKTIRGEFASNREFVTMFLDEAKIVSRVCHPNVVRYLELGSEAGHTYLVMELLFGQSLWSVWDACRLRGKRFDFDTIAWIGARVASGLHYAHELRDELGKPLDIVHRDVNATNIFVTYEGTIKVIDFGLAKAADRASKTAAGIIKGKVAYMSPEQALGAPIDRRTDIFALGTTLWELGCDRRLFKETDDVDTLRRVHAAVVPDPTTLVDDFPRPLARMLARALARDRDRRYASAAELARDLDEFVRARRVATAPAALQEGRTDAWPPLAALMRELFGPAEAAAEAMLAFSAPKIFAMADPGIRPTGTVNLDLCGDAVTLAPDVLSSPARSRSLPLVTVSVVLLVVTSATLLATCVARY
ncbi:MAG: serine/threonine protein kinase [Polyangiaceae bacterium]|nr:serine/threonine protein kinase [Polyangiaceae bacterium]